MVKRWAQERGSQLSVSDKVVERVLRLRHVRSMTRDELAAECAAAGFPELTGPALANIETGRRSVDGRRRRAVTVDELTVFARVFDVSPAELLALEQCTTCLGAPPAGMSCNACGSGGIPGITKGPPLRQPASKRAITADLLRDVAGTYREAVSRGLAPLKAIGERFEVSHSTAGRWVQIARHNGVLGKAIGNIAGEVSEVK